MNIQNDLIGLVLRQNCKSKQVTDFIAWPSRCHDILYKSSSRNIPSSKGFALSSIGIYSLSLEKL